MEEERLKLYFNNYEHYFWQWEENGEVASIPNGQTIAYREYLVEVLEALAPQGLPAFGAVLLALIVTNPSFSYSDNNHLKSAGESLESVKSITKGFFQRKQYDSDGFEIPNQNTLIGKFLKDLAELPKDYKTSTKRILVLQTIFKDAHNKYSVKDSKKIIELLKQKKVNLKKKEFSLEAFKQDVRTLSFAHRDFPTKESILEKIASLPKINKESLEIDEENKQNFNQNKEIDLVEQLTENKETFVIGSLIKSLFAGLNIPFHNTQPSQQPLGGVSDLTNKGSYDRLLISEYANDDLIFLSRLANNEALFLNREVPPQQNDSERVFLIDISLKNWGTPKILAFAVAIAISSHPKSDINCHFYLIDEHRYRKIELESVHNVIQSLLFFGTGLMARKGLELFFEEKTKELDLSNKEVFYLSSSEAIQEKLMQRTLEEHKKYISYWIHTDLETKHKRNTGKIIVYKKKQNSKTYIQTLNLNLDKLWANPPKKNKKSKGKQTLYSLVLQSATKRKIELIKKIRDSTTFSLREAKSKVDNTPQTIKTDMLLEEANNLRDDFEEIGAVVYLLEQENGKEREDNCPILFPKTTSKIKVYFSDTEFYLISTQKSLMQLKLNQKYQKGHYISKGWQRLHQNLDYKVGKICVAKQIGNDKIIIWLNINTKEVYMMNLESKVIEKTIFADFVYSNFSYIFEYKGVFYYCLDNRKLYVFDWTGKDKIKIYEVTTNKDEIIKSYTKFTENQSKVPHSIDQYSVLKNAKQVFINSENELVISKHKIFLNSGNIIKLQVADAKLEKILIAEAESKSEFVFEDGSSIFIDRDGMIFLNSSDENIPTIYIPSCLDTALGVGTDEYFAGIDYFLPLDNNLEKIENQLFYTKFIQKFIQTIIKKS